MDDVWSKRETFRKWVKDLKAQRVGWTNAQVAESMGLAPLSLKKYLGKSGTHKPGDDALRLLGDQLGRDYRLLLEEPGVAPSGIDASQWAQASGRSKIIATAMLTDLMALPEDQQEVYYQLWGQWRGLHQALLKEEKPPKKKKEKKP